MVRMKFTITSKEEVPGGGYNIKAIPVTSGSKENDEFFRWTPSGELKFGTINKVAADLIHVGKAYYIDISPTEEQAALTGMLE